MGNVFADSFGRYKVAAFTDADLHANFFSRYTNGHLSTNAEISASGRNGQCIHLGSGADFLKTLPHSSRWVTGFAYKADTSAAAIDTIYTILNNNTALFSLRQAADGTLAIYGANTPIDVTDRALLSGRWYYIECDVTLSGTPIEVTAELRINGHVEASGSFTTTIATNTLLSLAADANVHSFTSIAGLAAGNNWDDLYIKDTAGYYGDVHIDALFANGDGATQDWTPSTGATQFDLINTHPVDLTKWIEAVTVGKISTFDWENCPTFSGTIKAINLTWLALKNDEGTKAFRAVVGTAGADAQSATFYVSDVTPEYYEASWELDPATGMAWTQAGFNATQFGVELMA